MIRNLFAALLLSVSLVCSPVQALSQGTLVLLVDVSGSISPPRKQMQYNAYRMALKEITHLDSYNIEVIFFGQGFVHASSGNLSSALNAFWNPPTVKQDDTCLATPLSYIETMYDTLPKPVVIDISGDGVNSCRNTDVSNDLVGTAPVQKILDRLASKGARVNTLFLTPYYPGWQVFDSGIVQARDFYRDMVRNDGFSFEAFTEQEFFLALWDKLILEIAMLEE